MKRLVVSSYSSATLVQRFVPARRVSQPDELALGLTGGAPTAESAAAALRDTYSTHAPPFRHADLFTDPFPLDAKEVTVTTRLTPQRPAQGPPPCYVAAADDAALDTGGVVVFGGLGVVGVGVGVGVGSASASASVWSAAARSA